MKIKVYYRKNLKMSEGKLAAQVAHAVKNLGVTPLDCDIVVLKASDAKFNEYIKEAEANGKFYIQRDKGLTEVDPNTPTTVAWIVKDEVITLPYQKVVEDMCSLHEDVIFEYEGEKYKFLNSVYEYLIDEYGLENMNEVYQDFDIMYRNGAYKKLS